MLALAPNLPGRLLAKGLATKTLRTLAATTIMSTTTCLGLRISGQDIGVETIPDEAMLPRQRSVLGS